ncbi:unnamed protein product [Meganyctiphanes norvegica]|uniref:Beta-sarcoglycan n=1 Tax=Meganyctiphanes norvegica TaxID=48144 RepID=A0AAV2RVA7_MEGNR
MGDFTGISDSAAASLLTDGDSIAPSTLERATLTRQSRQSRSTLHTVSSEREMGPKLQAQGGESGFFWGLVVVLLLLALGNLLLTFFAMGVLRLGYGMESIEIIPGQRMSKFYGHTDLGNIVKKDGILNSYADAPFSITGDNSKVSLSLRTSKYPPKIEVGPDETNIFDVEQFKVISPTTGKEIFSTNYPHFGLPRGVQNLHVTKARTSRVTSPTSSDLRIQSDSTIRVRGNEGMYLDGGSLIWTADQDIYVKSVNGSILLSGGRGILVDVNTLPLASQLDPSTSRGQYKLCMCMPSGLLFRVPVPKDNNLRSIHKQINCASFSNPCSD